MSNIIGFEISNITWLLIFIIHSTKHNGNKSTIRIFLPSFIYGGICESFGILSGYYSEAGYNLYIPHIPAPIATISGWAIVYYLVINIIKDIESKINIKNKYLLKAIIGGIVATLIDVMIDPVAIRLGWWKWNQQLSPFIYGVPLINFAAWFFAVTVWLYFFYRIEATTTKNKLFLITSSIPLAAFIAGSLTFGFMEMVSIITNSSSLYYMPSFYYK